MNSLLWAKLHGGTTHFPIALTMASTFLDMAGYLVSDNPPQSRRATLRAAGLYALVLGAIGSLGAVVSGLSMSHGQTWGHGDLARHHLLLWPAFVMLIGLAAWRVILAAGNYQPTETAFKAYLAGAIIMCGLMGAAGYFGGELLLHS